MTKIKICGLSREEDISYVNEAKPDYCGFVINFPKSHRNVTLGRVRELVRSLDPSICPVGVFVNEPAETILSLTEDGTLGAVQLHGQESDAYVDELRRRLRQQEAVHPADQNISRRKDVRRGPVILIQAFRILSAEDVRRAEKSAADYILLDRGTGTGMTFDWDLVRDVNRPYFLAGGLGADNLEKAIRSMHPFAVDLSSSVETDRIKDREKIRRVTDIARNVGQQMRIDGL